jgi:hypothetical protein
MVVGLTDAFLDFSQHVSANNCHHQGGRSALETTRARSVLWMYVDYDSSSVMSVGCIRIEASILVQPTDITRTQYTKCRL